MQIHISTSDGVPIYLETIGLTGRLLLFLQLLVGLLALWFAWLVLAGHLLSYEARLPLTHTGMALCGAACVLGTAWAFAAARRRSLIGSPALSAAASVWALLSGCVVFEWLPHRTAPYRVAAVLGPGHRPVRSRRRPLRGNSAGDGME